MADVLRPDQPPLPDVDELAAVRALFKATATKEQQIRFAGYLLKMCGVAQSEYGTGEFWAFMGGKRWVATTLLEMAEVRMVTLATRKNTETENG
jgi:hypothetical protein